MDIHGGVDPDFIDKSPNEAVEKVGSEKALYGKRPSSRTPL
jgi:hypothetical protein